MHKPIVMTAIIGIGYINTVHSATLYDQDNITLNVKGDFQVQMYKKIGTDKDLDLDYDDLELKFGAEYKLPNGMTALGQLDVDWKNQGDGSDDDVVDEAYVGLQSADGNIRGTMGRVYWGTEDFKVEKAWEMDGGTAFLNTTTTSGSDSVRLDFKRNNTKAILAADIEDNDDESAVDLTVMHKIGNATLGVAYQNYKANSDANSIDTYGVLAKVKTSKAEIGVDYTSNDQMDVSNAVVYFPVTSQIKSAVGVHYESPETGDDVTQWYANATQKLHKHVSVFAEVGDSNKADHDPGYLAGMRVTF